MVNITSFLVIALALVFCAVGLYFFGQGCLRLVRPNPELTWVAVSGQVIESQVDQGYRGTKSASIRYQYQFQGTRHESHRIAPLEFWSGASTAEEFVKKYPRGLALTVYVNPSDPKSAVLEPKNQPVAALVAMVLGIAACLTGAMAIFMSVVGRT